MTLSHDDPRLTAYALGELDETERAQVEAALRDDAVLAAEVDAIRALACGLEAGLARESTPSLSDAQRTEIARASDEASASRGGPGAILAITRLAAAAVVLVAVAGWWLDLSVVDRIGTWLRGGRTAGGMPAEVATSERARELERLEAPDGKAGEGALGRALPDAVGDVGGGAVDGGADRAAGDETIEVLAEREGDVGPVDETTRRQRVEVGHLDGDGDRSAASGGTTTPPSTDAGRRVARGAATEAQAPSRSPFEYELGGAPGVSGNEPRAVGDGGATTSLIGRGRKVAAVAPAATTTVTAPSAPRAEAPADVGVLPRDDDDRWRYHRRIDPRAPAGGEGYDPIEERSFADPLRDPLSTFSIDVDTAAYANVRRFLNQGHWPPKDAVRIEEMINYFDYEYAPPTGEHPFATHVEVLPAPWRPEHRLVRVALQGRAIEEGERVGGNLVFLVDVSGSMNGAAKLPLVKSSLKLLLDRLDERDTVALVTYAGNTRVALEATACTPGGKRALRDAIDGLSSSGSTAGAAGIELAYEQATRHLVQDGVNRVILATDGDFNVGITDKDQLESLIADRAESGVFLTVLLYGTGNIKDDVAERLSNHGNGNYAYIDTLNEAHKVLVEQIGGTLLTIAKDVKIQVEFNPTKVGAYRLIGYENRALAARDFRDDRKDAGEIGAGHSVTALYEIVPTGVGSVPGVPPLRYQDEAAAPVELSETAQSDELLYVRLRYKKPDGDVGIEFGTPVLDEGRTLDEASADALFAVAVAEFGMLLRASPDRGDASFEGVLERARAGRGEDEGGYRAEFIRLVRVAQGLKGM